MEFHFYFETIPNKGVYCEIPSNLVLDVKLQKKIWKWENLEEGEMAPVLPGLDFGVSLLFLTNCASRASICCASRARLPSSARSVGRQAGRAAVSSGAVWGALVLRGFLPLLSIDAADPRGHSRFITSM